MERSDITDMVDSIRKDCIFSEFCNQTCSPVCMRYIEFNYLLKTSNIPLVKQRVNRLTPDSCDVLAFEMLAKIRDNILNFVDSGRNLYIYSNVCGNGKTTWAIKLMLQYFNEVWAGNAFTKRGLFVNTPTFLSMCKSTISHPDKDFSVLREDLTKVDLLIFDDIASTKLSEYDYNTLLNYIDQRVLNEKSTIYTGNVKPKDMHLYLGNRLTSRICNSNSMCIELKGRDMR